MVPPAGLEPAPQRLKGACAYVNTTEGMSLALLDLAIICQLASFVIVNCVEPPDGIEPSLSAYETLALPLDYGGSKAWA